MGKNKKYLFASDLDGTLLTHWDYTVHSDVYKAIKALIKEGHMFMPVTGRSYWFTKKILDQFGIEHHGIFFNGHEVVVRDQEKFHKQNKDSVIKGLTKKDITNILNTDNLHKHVSSITVTGLNQHFTFQNKKELQTLFYEAYETVLYVKKDDKYDFDKLEKDLVKKFPKFQIKFWKNFSAKYVCIAINPTKMNKGKALEKVAKHYNIPKENIIYFGDNINDFEAFKFAKHSVAPANAIEDIKKIAKYVSKHTNDEGAVGKYILEFLGKK